jgi:general secretion pathway protein M
MIVKRLTDMPAYQRLTAWWAGLSQRERYLVGGLGVLLALTVLVYGVVKPLQAARAQALADIRTYETLNARIRAAGPITAPGPAPRTGSPESIVTTSAGAFGLAVQTQPSPDGITVTIAEGGYDAVMNWLADIARTSSLSVTRVDLQKRPTSGFVAATVEFRG